MTTFGPCDFIIEWRDGKLAEQCGAPSTFRYPAYGGTYANLCEQHGEKHRDYSEHLESVGSITFGRHAVGAPVDHRTSRPA